MSYIRWFKISEALARAGHTVDIATAEWKFRLRKPTVSMGPRLRRVPLSRVDWSSYDVVKTLFHQGFETLARRGGGSHPFIISKLGSVVGPADMDGIYFYGKRRRRLYETQEAINTASRFITVLSPPALDLWASTLGRRDDLLLVPGAVDRDIPGPGPNPFDPSDGRIRCLFSGNVYRPSTQPEANRVLIDKLNTLGRLLGDRGARLYLLGPGFVGHLDPAHVTYLGAVSYARSWDYMHHADVGVLLAAGAFMHNNESTKIYHYLRAGLPVVSEAGFPNDGVLEASGLAHIVANGDLEALAERIAESARQSWDRDSAIRYILEHHTWDARAAVYDRLLHEYFT